MSNAPDVPDIPAAVAHEMLIVLPQILALLVSPITHECVNCGRTDGVHEPDEWCGDAAAVIAKARESQPVK